MENKCETWEQIQRKNGHLQCLSSFYSSYPNNHQVLLSLPPHHYPTIATINPTIAFFEPIIISCLGKCDVASQVVPLLQVCPSRSPHLSCLRMKNLELSCAHLIPLLGTLKGSPVSLMSRLSSIICTSKPPTRCPSWTFLGHVPDPHFVPSQQFTIHSKLSLISCIVLTQKRRSLNICCMIGNPKQRTTSSEWPLAQAGAGAVDRALGFAVGLYLYLYFF